MSVWFAPFAWLGGSGFDQDVSIVVSGGYIESVEVGSRPSSEAVRLEGVVLPGLVSAHSHAFHRALRGHTHAAGGDFWAWRRAMYELAQRLEPDSYRSLATEVFGEMLRAGITTVGEFHYLHHRVDGRPYPEAHAMEHALIGAALDAGIRMTLLDTCYLTSEVTGAPPLPEQRRFSDGSATAWSERVADLANRGQGRTVKIGVAAHSVRAVPPSGLAMVGQLADDLDLPAHAHVSEQRAENEACLAEHGTTPMRLLADTGFLSGRATAVHATHLSEGDRELLASSGAGVCFCPSTEQDLGDGIGPGRELRDHGVSISLGSDSNATVDLFEEARSLELNDRLRLERRGIHSPDELLRSATGAGLAALGWGVHEPLAVDSPADFVAVGVGGPAMSGFDPIDGVGAFLFSTPRTSVSDVIVAGQRVVHTGQNTSGQSGGGLHRLIRELMP